MYKLRNTNKYDKNNKEVKHRLQRPDNYIRDAVHWD